MYVCKPMKFLEIHYMTLMSKVDYSLHNMTNTVTGLKYSVFRAGANHNIQKVEKYRPSVVLKTDHFTLAQDIHREHFQ